MNRFGVRQKIWGIVALFVLGLAALGALSVLSTREALLDQKKQKTRHLVEAAFSLVDHYARLEATGVMNGEDAREAAMQALRALRYDGREYFWVHDMTSPFPRMLVHPLVPALEGQILDDPAYECAETRQLANAPHPERIVGTKNLFLAFNEVVTQGGAGFVTYLWPKPLEAGGATRERFPKVSFVKRHPAWDWVIGSGIYVDDVDALAWRQAVGEWVAAGVIGGVLLVLASLLASGIAERLAHSTRRLSAMVEGREKFEHLPVGRRDEIGLLIEAFNSLQDAVAVREDHLRLSASVFENAREGITITDVRGRIVAVNPSFTQLTGYAASEVLGQNPSILKSGLQGEGFYEDMWQRLSEYGFWQGEIWNRRKTGDVYVEMLTITSVRNDRGEPTHYVGIFSDVTAQKEQQQRLERMAHYDVLTQLPNRALLADRLQVALVQAARKKDTLAVAFIDLDEFKPVNDRLGHEAGDQLLIEVAHRLRQCVRSGDTVARLGGDEFVLLLVGLREDKEVEFALDRILASLGEPFSLKGERVNVSASIGVTLYPEDGSDPDVLLRHADQAMYAAKQAGRNRYHLFDAEHDRRSRLQRKRLSDIRSALAHCQFVLYYQPKVNLRRGQMIGAEALIRWCHPQRGILPPGEFLPVVEGSEFDIRLGDWVIETALDQMTAWLREGQLVNVSVNVSAAQLQAPDFTEKLTAALARHPELPRYALELEILETTALDDVDRASRVIDACRALGVTFALDDFGTGYSSLTYCKRLPARMLKIDRSFVRDMLNSSEDHAIIEGVIGFGRAFQREVLAEGVETPEHGALLLHMGCELVQGYGIARPMPADELLPWSRAFRLNPVWLGGALELGYQHFPLLHAEADHRRWVSQLTDAVADPAAEFWRLPPIDPHQCAFGRWLDGHGRDLYGDTDAFQRVDQCHREVHRLGEQLVEHSRGGRRDGVAAGLPGLRAAGEALVGELETLRTVALHAR